MNYVALASVLRSSHARLASVWFFQIRTLQPHLRCLFSPNGCLNTLLAWQLLKKRLPKFCGIILILDSLTSWLDLAFFVSHR